MKMTAIEIKQLTGAKCKIVGENILYGKLQSKKWYIRAREYTLAGYDRRKDQVHFTAAWSASEGVAGHSRVALSLKAAISCQDGELFGAEILH